MIKLLILVKRNPALTYEEFREHLSVRHSQLVRDCPASNEDEEFYHNGTNPLLNDDEKETGSHPLQLRVV